MNTLEKVTRPNSKIPAIIRFDSGHSNLRSLRFLLFKFNSTFTSNPP